MDYDYDVIIVGSGPAGISAAIRVRWVKTYLTVPCSVLILDTSEIGGLSNWKGVNVTGPSWAYSNERLSEIFRNDINNLSIDSKKEEVLDVDLDNDVKIVKTSRNEYRCLSLIISTGMKKITNEKDFIGKGLNFVSRGYGYTLEKFKKLFEENEGKRILVIGTEKSENLRQLFNELNKNRNELIYITEPETTVLRFFGTDRLEGIEVLENGTEKRIKCDEAIVDFNSYELKPTSTSFLNKHNLLDDKGFVKTEKNQKTSIPGVFAAGDVTGYPSNFGKAIGQGIVAGLEAYRYVFKKKFNEEPNLFAFYPKDFMIAINHSEIPKITKLDLKPKILTKLDDPILRELQINGVAKSFDGKHTLKEILSIHDIKEGKLLDTVNSLIRKKKMTVHI